MRSTAEVKEGDRRYLLQPKKEDGGQRRGREREGGSQRTKKGWGREKRRAHKRRKMQGL